MLASAISTPCGSSARASSSAYVHTPPIGSTVIKILRGAALDVCVFINSIERRGYLDHSFDVGIKRAVECQPPRPFHCGAPKPFVRRFGQNLSRRAVEAFGNKIVKRAVRVTQRSAAFVSVEGRLDDGIASGVQMPRATQIDHRAVGEIQSRCGVVFTNRIDPIDSVALMKKPAAHIDNWLIENPQRGVYEMNSEIDNATATGLLPIVKPWLLRTISIVKNEIDCVDLTEVISPNELPNFL